MNFKITNLNYLALLEENLLKVKAEIRITMKFQWKASKK